MYESPINAYFGEIETQFDGAVFKAVQSVGIDVKKDELIKALAYDRDQYERGYHDGLMFRPAIITNADRTRSMTDEELAEWAWSVESSGRAYGPRGKKAWLDWLKKEADK